MSKMKTIIAYGSFVCQIFLGNYKSIKWDTFVKNNITTIHMAVTLVAQKLAFNKKKKGKNRSISNTNTLKSCTFNCIHI